MCIFCKIIAGEIPSKKVYEDEDILAILDISQAQEGHTLVMPKKHFDNFLDCDKDILNKLMSKAQDLAKDIILKLKADGCNILINTNEAAGQSVMHLHIHIIPRFKDDDLKIEFKEHKLDLDEVLNKLK